MTENKPSQHPLKKIAPLVLLFFILAQLLCSIITFLDGYFMFHMVIIIYAAFLLISLIPYAIGMRLLRKKDASKTLLTWASICLGLFTIINIVGLYFHVVETLTPHPWPFG